MIADLPGYGFARLSQKDYGHLSELIPEYILNRDRLKMLFILIDSRHEFKKSDGEVLQFLLANEIGFGIIATKSDKSSALKNSKSVRGGKRLH